ncbi:CaiB/BaiF CoA transferase family protein [Aurantiacibacter gangjinensis]|uniref:CoA-transferase n=1 Tax=Aurantiacibacter gangjinensis TaxID=502682 RepID=A0A0G9MRT4_9SPHN|nr:CoA transferase [Aurantiacibacter gangjinensis]APE28112.1 CAIB/BAIF family protein [Aurantiacibacter gangjinensis]KLE32033.1 CoA-transferase [Aurantiacibacter gangjinensis]
MTADLPLKGFRILSAEQYGAGPYGTMHLAQMGADVIKIEPPRRNGKGGGDTARAVGPHFLRDGESLYFQSFNYNKRSLTLDLRTEQGQAVLHSLVAESHAVANNMRGDLPAKLGLDYASLRDINPAVVCAHLSAYGRDNARAKWPGYDYLVQAEAGYCQMTGEPGGEPQRMGLSMVDFMTGCIFTIGLLAALLDAQRSGRGRDVDTDLYSAGLHQTSYPALWYINEGDETQRTPRSAHPTATPSQMFKAKDGWMFVMCQLPKFWDILCERIGREDLLADKRFTTNADRLANRDALTELLDAHFETQPMAHWQELLGGHVPVAPVYELSDALDNPWAHEVGMRQTIAHPDKAAMHTLASPIRLDGQRLENRAAPLLGADTDAILAEVGYDEDAIAALREGGIV